MLSTNERITEQDKQQQNSRQRSIPFTLKRQSDCRNDLHLDQRSNIGDVIIAVFAISKLIWLPWLKFPLHCFPERCSVLVRLEFVSRSAIQ